MESKFQRDSDGFLLRFELGTSEAEKKDFLHQYPRISALSKEKFKCLTCHKAISTKTANSFKTHPVLKVTVCKKCYDFYHSGDDYHNEGWPLNEGYEIFCRWCGDGGDLVCCSRSGCHFAFCRDCIQKNLNKFDFGETDEWACCVCDKELLKELRAKHWALTNFVEQCRLSSFATANHARVTRLSVAAESRKRSVRRTRRPSYFQPSKIVRTRAKTPAERSTRSLVESQRKPEQHAGTKRDEDLMTTSVAVIDLMAPSASSDSVAPALSLPAATLSRIVLNPASKLITTTVSGARNSALPENLPFISDCQKLIKVNAQKYPATKEGMMKEKFDMDLLKNALVICQTTINKIVTTSESEDFKSPPSVKTLNFLNKRLEPIILYALQSLAAVERNIEEFKKDVIALEQDLDDSDDILWITEPEISIVVLDSSEEEDGPAPRKGIKIEKKM